MSLPTCLAALALEPCSGPAALVARGILACLEMAAANTSASHLQQPTTSVTRRPLVLHRCFVHALLVWPVRALMESLPSTRPCGGVAFLRNDILSGRPVPGTETRLLALRRFRAPTSGSVLDRIDHGYLCTIRELAA
jgi:hypothetical protein